MEDYTYSKVPITPAIIEELTIDLFNGKTIKREEIVKKVLDHHLLNGGLPPESIDFTRSVKRALENLLKKGWARNKSRGNWEIIKEDSLIIEENEFQEESILQEEDNADEKISAQTVYGNGNSAVYLYYFESYKKLATVQNNTTWPCKIGRTDRDPLIRILTQASTALPENPIIEFVIKTDNSNLLETMLHSILKVRGKNLENSPGSEWFNTNPEEVIEIIEFVNKDILK